MISIAGFKDIYSVSSVTDAMAEAEEGPASEPVKSVLRRMLKCGAQRFSMKPSALPDIDGLIAELPNFEEPLEDIRRQLALCLSSDDPLELEPILLLGDPGIGKTHFARRLAQLVGTSYNFMSMSSMTGGFILSGTAPQWSGSKPGKVFETLVYGDYSNPVVVVDEIDKASKTTQYDPLGSLYTLLEHDTARRFVDEFVDVPIDAADVVWVATANDMRQIPEPLLSRLNAYQIEPPDADGCRRIAASVYHEIRSEHAWGRAFPEAPSAGVLDLLAALTPREMRRHTLNAFGSAKLAGRNEMWPEDVEQRRLTRRSIGFGS